MIEILILVALAFTQSISFSLASRSRNRDNMYYHTICSVFSNGLFFVTLNYLVLSDLTYWMAIPYIIGTVSGSVFGAKISMKIEKIIGAKT